MRFVRSKGLSSPNNRAQFCIDEPYCLGISGGELTPERARSKGIVRIPKVRYDSHERAAFFDHTVRGALSTPHTSRAPGFATQDHARARDFNTAQGNTQDMEATLANLLRKECQGCSEV